jgi:DNA-binding transcriptional LysR family regulator
VDSLPGRELERVRSQIQDLTGLRRGHIRIACSQALALFFLPAEIAAFRADAPGVTFEVTIRDHEAAIAALAAFEADLALVFRPGSSAVWQPIATLGQRLIAIMSVDHELASQDRVRLRDCAAYPVALPHQDYGTRQVLDACLAGKSAQFKCVLVSDSFELLRNFCREGDTITFQVEIGAPPPGYDPRLVCRPVDDREGAHGPLVLGQLRSRLLPVAAAKFADQLAKRLNAAGMFGNFSG